MAGALSVVDGSWELIDPNPNIHQLFQEFNQMFFWGRLDTVYVQWSERMTLCAGTCKFSTRSRECSIQLSKPLLSYRPRKDLVETLLHEMIHAFLFVADNNRERESHGPKFHEHMYRINKMTGANITVYHSFHDEVNHFKTHWWKCDGPCKNRPPYFGIVKRSMNRAPGPNDFWFKDHQANCGGTFIKIKEPEPGEKRKGKKGETSQKPKKIKSDEKTSPPTGGGNENKNKITNYFKTPAVATITSLNDGDQNPATSSSSDTMPEVFSGRGFVLGSIGNSSVAHRPPSSSFATSSTTSSFGGNGSSKNIPRRGEHPLLVKWMQNHSNHSATLSNPKQEPVTRPIASSSSSSSTNDDLLTFSEEDIRIQRELFELYSSSSTKNPAQKSSSSSRPVEIIDLD